MSAEGVFDPEVYGEPVYTDNQSDTEIYGELGDDVAASSNGYGQAQADILHTYQGYGQCQALIIPTRAYGQAQGDIKQTYQGYGQCQANIGTKYNACGQAQALIIPTRVYGQAQGDILQTYQAYAQAQADILQTYQGYGQAQGNIINTYQGYGQSQADILHAYQAYAQANADVLATSQAYGQAQAKIGSNNYGWGQAQAKINTTRVHAQAQGYIRPRVGLGQANALIATIVIYDTFTRTVSTGSLGTPDIGSAYNSGSGTSYSETSVDGSEGVFNTPTPNNSMGARNDEFVRQGLNQIDFQFNKIVDDFQAIRLFARVPIGTTSTRVAITLSYNSANVNWDFVLSSLGSSPQTTTFAAGTFVVDTWYTAKIIYNGTTIKGKVWQTGTVEPDWQLTLSGSTVTGAGQSLFNNFASTPFTGNFIELFDNYQVFTLAEIIKRGYGQAQAYVVYTLQGYGQAQAYIPTTRVYGQAQALIIPTRVYGQANADVKATSNGYGQANAQISQPLNGFGQAQGSVIKSYQAWAQAQADIKVITNSYGQSNASIKLVIYKFGQAQAFNVNTRWGLGQAQAYLFQGSVNGQARATIKRTEYRLAQALANIDSPIKIKSASSQALIIKPAGYGQAVAFIFQSKAYGWGQAHTDIKKITRVFGYALALIKDRRPHAQAQAYIKGKPRGYAQAQALINKGRGLAQAQAYISPAKGRGYAQAAAYIWITKKFAQAQAQIIGTYFRPAQAQSKIKVTKIRAYGQAQAQIAPKRVFGQAQAIIITTTAFGQANADINVTSQAYGQATVEIIGNYGYGQALATIFATPTAFAQAQALVLGYVLLDTFTRIETTGNIGTPDIGPAYDTGESTLTDISVDGAQGILTGGGSAFIWAPVDEEDLEVYVEFTYTDYQIGSQVQIDVRELSDFSEGISAGYSFDTEEFTVFSVHGSGDSGNLSFPLVSNVTYAMKFRVYTITGKFKIWDVTTDEPDWMLEYSDIENTQNSGAVALTFTNTGATPMVFDNFRITNGFIKEDTLLDTFSRTTSLGEIGNPDIGPIYGPFITDAGPSNYDTGLVDGSVFKFDHSLASSGDPDYGWAWLLSPIDIVDSNFYIEFMTERETVYIEFDTRQRFNPTNYVQVWYNYTSNGWIIAYITDNTGTSSGTFPYEISPNTWYSVRFMVVGNTAKFKIWIRGTTEPASWLGEYSNASFPTGGGSFATYIDNDSNRTNTFMYLDNWQSQEPLYQANGQAQASVSQPSPRKYGQAQAFMRGQNFGRGQARAYIPPNIIRKFAQARALISTPTTVNGQAQAQIINITSQVYGQAQANMANNPWSWAQARAKIIQTDTRKYGQAQAYIFGTKVAQAQAYITRFNGGLGQAQSTIFGKSIKYGQAKALISNRMPTGMAMADINSAVLEDGTPTYLVSYNSYHLPGYAQEESIESLAETVSIGSRLSDIPFTEYLGLRNSKISVRMLVIGDTYLERKNQVQKAATIVRSKREGFADFYLNYHDRHFEAMALSIKMDADASETRTSQYSLEFEAKPWIIKDASITVSGVNFLTTTGRTIDNGGWTPTTVRFTGTDVTVSGYTDSGDFTGYISVSGFVQNMEIDTEAYTTTDDSTIVHADYQLYVGPGVTNFSVTGATEITITYQDRWYL